MYNKVLIFFLFFLSHKVFSQIKYTDLGPQLLDKTIEGSAFYQSKDGNKYVYTVVRGQPAHLLGYNLRDNKLITDIAIESNNGSPSIVFSTDGILYISGQAGILYAHVPGSSSIKNLGKCLGTETVMYDLRAGRNGEIYGGTYPGCKIFRYHPKDGFTDVGKGAMVAGENYVRSMVYHKKANKIYAGVGAHAALIELDLATGSKRDILPENYKNQQFVYSMALIENVSDGDRIFATLQNSGITLIYNIAKKTIEHETKGVFIKAAIKSSLNNEIYFTQAASKLMAYKNIHKQDFTSTAVENVSANAIASEVYDGILYMLSAKGEVIKYDLSNHVFSSSNVNISGQPKLIGLVHEGPLKSIWTSGYLNGSNSSFKSTIGKTETFEGLNQTESAALYNKNIYFGTYTKAKFYIYDSTKPWKMGANPKSLGSVPEQDRPFGALAVPSMGKVFFGTVPGYGRNGGVLVEFDAINNNKMSYYPDVVKDQSIITLAHSNGKLFGGTSVWGGLGGNAGAAEAKLFVWDIATKTKIHEIVPVPGAKTITCLINGNDGNIWGIAQGYLFKVNPENYAVISKTKIYTDNRFTHVWRPDQLVLNPADNMYYGTIAHNLFRLNPKDMSMKMLDRTGKDLTLGPNNEMYFAKEGNLWKMEIVR